MAGGPTLSDLLRRAAVRSPRHLAYAYDRAEHDWATVDARVNALAGALQRLGLRKGDVIASCCHDGPVLVEVLFAAARIGLIRVGINYRYAAQDVAVILRHCGAKLLIVQDDFRALAKDVEGEIRQISCGDGQSDLGEYAELLAGAHLSSVDEPVSDEDIAQICYTTGSTGAPKGAVWTHRNIVHAASHTLLDLGFHADDVWLHCLPGAGVPSVLDVWNVVLGNTSVILRQFDPKACLEAIQRYRVTRTVWVPTMLFAVCEVAEKASFDTASMRRISYGSAPTPPALIRRALLTFKGAVFDQWYGSTEGAGGWYTHLTPSDHARALNGEEHLLESCGKAMHHAEVAVLDDAGRPCPVAQVGEICVKGAFVMQGYLNDPARTEETLRDGWLRTGDMGRQDAEGYVYLVDRKQFMIITGGYNVYPVEVENALAAHRDVAECCVFGIPDEKWGEAVHALVVLREGCTAGVDELRSWCSERLAAFKVPKAVEIRKTLMRGPTGKIQKRAHKEEFWRSSRP